MTVEARVPSAGARGLRRWLVIGARPRTLPASLVPVVVGTAAARAVPSWRTAAALVVALGMQVGVNYANDASDAARGVDTEHRVGPPRVVAGGLASARAVWTAATVAFGAAAVAGLALAVVTTLWLIAAGALAVVAALGYSGGPRPYAALGLGEVFVFAFFGLLATVGTAWVHLERFVPAAWWSAVLVGFLAVALLVVNNLRDIETDAAAGKRTLAVRIGSGMTRSMYALLVLDAFLVIPLGVVTGALPLSSALCLLAFPLVIRPLMVVGSASGRDLLPALGATARLQLVTGVLLAAGLWWGVS